MYLWVIIVTFLAVLATLGTSLRSDIKEIYVEPQAEVVVNKLFIQHRGLMKYALQAEHDEGDELRDGSWEPNTHKAYFPHGFNVNGQFKSKIYCLDQSGNKPSECQAGPGGEPAAIENCCQVPNRVLYLMTYGKLPPKWREKKTSLPRPELLNAMRHNGGQVQGMGVLDSYEHSRSICGELICHYYTDHWGVVHHGFSQFYGIPDSIAEGDGDFKSQCIKSNSDGTYSSNYCLMYVSKY